MRYGGALRDDAESDEVRITLITTFMLSILTSCGMNDEISAS